MITTRCTLLFASIGFSGVALAQTPTPITYSNVVALDELNIEASADAYPWISTDGLRLYFTQETVADDKLFLATRAAVTDPFGVPQPLLPTGPVEQVSGWLTPDELTLWYTSGSSVFRVSRASISDAFGMAVGITLDGFTGTVKSPSVTPDAQQLIIYSSGNIILELTATDTYTQIGPLLTGVTNTGPAKMSADGLTVWFGGEFNGVRIPHRMTRGSTTDAFGNVQYFAGSGFDAGYSWIQPHLTPDGAILVGTRSSSGTWQGNDLYRAEGDVGSAIASTEWVDVPALFPNPANERLYVTLPDGWTTADVEVFDANGRLCLQHAAREQDPAPLDIDGLAPGIYAVELIGNGTRIGERVVIER